MEWFVRTLCEFVLSHIKQPRYTSLLFVSLYQWLMDFLPLTIASQLMGTTESESSTAAHTASVSECSQLSTGNLSFWWDSAHKLQYRQSNKSHCSWSAHCPEIVWQPTIICKTQWERTMENPKKILRQMLLWNAENADEGVTREEQSTKAKLLNESLGQNRRGGLRWYR